MSLEMNQVKYNYSYLVVICMFDLHQIIIILIRPFKIHYIYFNYISNLFLILYYNSIANY